VQWPSGGKGAWGGGTFGQSQFRQQYGISGAISCGALGTFVLWWNRRTLRAWHQRLCNARAKGHRYGRIGPDPLRP
jgi:hypothetical protein